MKHVKIFDSFDELGIKKDELTIKFLNRLLANYFVLFMKLWNFHWNITGYRFKNVHEHLNELYDKFFEEIDNVAERIRVLNGKPISTLKGYLEISEIEEYDDKNTTPDADEIYKVLLRDYEFIIREIRNFSSTEGIDQGTLAFLDEEIEEREKESWMIRSQLK